MKILLSQMKLLAERLAKIKYKLFSEVDTDSAK